jgi:hypothetical protein
MIPYYAGLVMSVFVIGLSTPYNVFASNANTNATSTGLSNEYLMSNFTSSTDVFAENLTGFSPGTNMTIFAANLTGFSPGTNATSVNITSFSATGASNLQIATFGGWYVYQVWQQQGPGGNTSDIFVRVSQDGGRTYSEPVNLSNNTGIPLYSINPEVGAFADDVYIIWEGIDEDINRSNIYFINSTNGGSTFGEPLNISRNPQSNAVESTLLVDKDTGKVLVGYIEGTGPTVDCRTRC